MLYTIDPRSLLYFVSIEFGRGLVIVDTGTSYRNGRHFIIVNMSIFFFLDNSNSSLPPALVFTLSTFSTLASTDTLEASKYTRKYCALCLLDWFWTLDGEIIVL